MVEYSCPRCGILQETEFYSICQTCVDSLEEDYFMKWERLRFQSWWRKLAERMILVYGKAQK